MINNRPLVLLLLACCLAQPALGVVCTREFFGVEDVHGAFELQPTLDDRQVGLL